MNESILLNYGFEYVKCISIKPKYEIYLCIIIVALFIASFFFARWFINKFDKGSWGDGYDRSSKKKVENE